MGLETAYKPLSELAKENGNALKSPFWGVARCLYLLRKDATGTHHGDISHNNLMHAGDEDGRPRGVLNEFDLAVDFRLPECRPGFERTGTFPFMAIDLLTMEGWCGEIPRCFRHDLESLTMWALLWLAYCFDEHGKELEINPFSHWLGSQCDRATLLAKKTTEFPLDWDEAKYNNKYHSKYKESWLAKLPDLHAHWKAIKIDIWAAHRHRVWPDMKIMKYVPPESPSIHLFRDVLDKFGRDRVPTEVDVWCLAQDLRYEAETASQTNHNPCMNFVNSEEPGFPAPWSLHSE